MGEIFANFVQLAVLTMASLFLACKLANYPIPDIRKVGAAGAFALVYNLPLGMIIHIVAPLVLWFLLRDPEVDKTNRLPVFLLTYLFTAMLTLLFYKLTH